MDGFFYLDNWGAASIFLAGFLLAGLLFRIRLRRRLLWHERNRRVDCFRLMVDSAGEGIWLLGASAHILYANHRIAEMLDVPSEAMMGKPLFHFVDSQERPLVENHFKRSRLQRDEHFEVRLRKSGGGSIWTLVASRLLAGSNGVAIGTLWIVTDISDRKEREKIACHLTQRDSLTGLPNRTLLFDRIMQDIGRASRYDRHVAILFLDLDRFKPVNDKFGHAAGDQVLQEVARRIASRVRRIDTVARFGGDEFVVVLPDLASPDEVEPVAEVLVSLLNEPVSTGDWECAVGVSIGVSLFPEDGRSCADLIDKADMAMYAVKQAGGGGYGRYAAKVEAE